MKSHEIIAQGIMAMAKEIIAQGGLLQITFNLNSVILTDFRQIFEKIEIPVEDPFVVLKDFLTQILAKELIVLEIILDFRIFSEKGGFIEGITIIDSSGQKRHPNSLDNSTRDYSDIVSKRLNNSIPIEFSDSEHKWAHSGYPLQLSSPHIRGEIPTAIINSREYSVNHRLMQNNMFDCPIKLLKAAAVANNNVFCYDRIILKF